MSRKTISKPKSVHAHEARKRPCLQCGEGFRSSWNGERICLPCKQLKARRHADGLPYQWEGLTA